MDSKVYVGNLSYECTNEDLQQKFGEFGEVTEAVIINDKFTGRSKGFGFVTFAKAEDAKNAIDSMNGKELLGRTLRVNEARQPRTDRRRNF